MKKIMQFRYISHPNSENYPNYDDYPGELTKRNIFNDYNSISQLGIQAPPGLVFYLNNSSSPLMVGKTGIYELNLEGIGRINAIRFDQKTLTSLISNTDSRLIIDIIYDGGTV